MRKTTIIAVLWLMAVAAKAQYTGYTLLKDASSFEASFAAASEKITSIKSDFVQEKNLSLLADKIVSKGKFWFRKENAVRMEYVQPFQYLLVINGNNVYIKDSQKESRVSMASNKLFRQINRIIIDCVNGKALQNKEFSFKVFESKAAYLVELTPVEKNLKTLFSHINLFVDRADFAVSRIEMHEPSGDYTSMRFVQRQFNTPLADALFTIR